MFAGYTYWFPKAFGFKLNERLGKMIFWCWFIGFYFAFMPLYALGILGATRRMQHYADPSWQPYMLVALSGAVFILCGIGLTVLQLIVSIRQREQNRDKTGDPWNGRTLEWSIPSPPPEWNFANLPRIEGTDAFWTLKEKGLAAIAADSSYTAIEMPRSNPTGFFMAFCAVVTGFALIWHIWWMASIGFVGAILLILAEAWRKEEELEIPAKEVALYYARAKELA
jgi:cytochrome o ubiquinol oxidase subunit 1